MSKTQYQVAVGIVAIIIICLIGLLFKEKVFGKSAASFINYAGDVIGTKSATTTTGVGFSITGSGGQSATTTYVNRIGNLYKEAIYTGKVTYASSSANLHFSILGSNDDGCETTATSTTDVAYTSDMVLTGEVNWFDIGDHLLNKVHSTSLGVGTSTLAWDNPVAGTGRAIILNDLNYECLGLQVSGSSTVLWGQLKIR